MDNLDYPLSKTLNKPYSISSVNTPSDPNIQTVQTPNQLTQTSATAIIQEQQNISNQQESKKRLFTAAVIGILLLLILGTSVLFQKVSRKNQKNDIVKYPSSTTKLEYMGPVTPIPSLSSPSIRKSGVSNDNTIISPVPTIKMDKRK